MNEKAKRTRYEEYLICKEREAAGRGPGHVATLDQAPDPEHGMRCAFCGTFFKQRMETDEHDAPLSPEGET